MIIAQKNTERVLGLDILRAYAIVSVLYGHAFELIKQHLSATLQMAYWGPVWDGVTLFFVLSGFLVGRIMISVCATNKPGFIDLVEFWVLRWLRTIPLYFVVLTTIVFIYWLSGKPNQGDWWKYYLFLQNLNWPHPDIFAEAWSLSVEEWFYFLAPVGFWLVYIYAKSTKTAALKLILFVIGACIVYHVTIYITHPITNFDEWNNYLRNVVLSRLSSIMFGVLAAYICIYKNEFWMRARNISLGFGIVILIFDKIVVFSTFNNEVGVFYLGVINLTISPLGFSLLLPYFAGVENKSTNRWWLLAGVVAYISKISYSLYLVNHTLVRELLFGFMITWLNISLASGRDAIVVYFLYYLLSILMAAILWRSIESPIMKYRRQLKESFFGNRKSDAGLVG